MKPLFESISFLNNKSSDDIEESYKKLMKEFFTVFKKYCKDGTPKLVDKSLDDETNTYSNKKTLHIVVTGCKNNDTYGNSVAEAFKNAADEFGFQKTNYGHASKCKKYPSLTLDCYTDSTKNNIGVIFCVEHVKKK